MLVTEYIAALEAFLAEHGNLPVETTTGFSGERDTAPPPELAYRAILSGRSWKQRFAMLSDKDKGDPVCRI